MSTDLDNPSPECAECVSLLESALKRNRDLENEIRVLQRSCNLEREIRDLRAQLAHLTPLALTEEERAALRGYRFHISNMTVVLGGRDTAGLALSVLDRLLASGEGT